jgi:hypothetical protein
LALQKIIIQVGDQVDLDKTITKLEKVGTVDEKNAKAFKAHSKSTQESIDKNTQKLGLFDKALSNIGPVMAGAFAISNIMSLGKAIIDTTAQFQRFEAVLINTLGSKSEAQKSLAMIKDFAASTPFGVAELTDSFVKLVNSGFKPTGKEMRKLGDLAASQGKSFNQLTEGIIDAQTGEFERLKEFGIRASKEGDKVSFTFKGVKTQTDFTSDSIQKYILSLGDLQGVSGGMAAISQTLGGQISNLGDSFDSLYNTIGSGNSGFISGAIGLLSDLVKGLEYALMTEEQLRDMFKQMESTARENRFFAFLEEDINALVKTGADAADARRLVYAGQIIEIEKDLELNRKQLEKHQEMYGKFISDPQKDILKEFQDNIDFSESALKRLSETLIKIDKEQNTSRTKTTEEIEKEFKLRLDLLKKLEGIAIRRAELEGKTEGDIIRIQENFNVKLIDLFR